MIGLAYRFRAMLRMMTGDVKQCAHIVEFKGVSMSKDASKAFPAQFGYQLALLMPKRLIEGGFDIHYLFMKHRAKGGSSSFASDRFYDRQMKETTHISHWSPEQTRVRQFLAKSVGRLGMHSDQRKWKSIYLLSKRLSRSG